MPTPTLPVTSGVLQILWEQPDATLGDQIPSAARTIRLVARPQTGPSCCVAVDPSGGSFTLTDLPVGPATLEVAGFAAQTAGVADINATCPTEPAGLGRTCGPVGAAPASFQSSLADITIVPGGVEGQQVAVHAFPFLIALQPGPGTSARDPVTITFAVVAAVYQIDPNSVSIEITQPGSPSIGPVIPILEACDDAGAMPCGAGGALAVSGFHATSGPHMLALGSAMIRIRARSLALEPRALDFAFALTVLEPLPTATPTSTQTTIQVPTATLMPTATSAPTATEPVRPTRTARNTPTETPTGTATVATNTPTTTPTATPAGSATLQAGCPATPVGGCFAAGRTKFQLENNTDDSRDQLKWEWRKGVVAGPLRVFGDPLNGGTSYKLCIYDSTGGVAHLERGLFVDAGGTCGTAQCWEAISLRGWKYKNPNGNSDGVTFVRLKAGDAGEPSVILRAKGFELRLPEPSSPSDYFDVNPAVVLQWHSSDPMNCWSQSYGTSNLDRNDPAEFDADTP